MIEERFAQRVIVGDRLNVGGYLFAAYPEGNKVYPAYIHRDSLQSRVYAR
ncbi:hypothetical protein [Paenibacillus silvisoli]|nr:hypothetical protein [Paenibacillus silvisoli]